MLISKSDSNHLSLQFWCLVKNCVTMICWFIIYCMDRQIWLEKEVDSPSILIKVFHFLARTLVCLAASLWLPWFLFPLNEAKTFLEILYHKFLWYRKLLRTREHRDTKWSFVKGKSVNYINFNSTLTNILLLF